MESLAKYSLEKNGTSLCLIKGGAPGGSTSTAPQSTASTTVTCSDSQVVYDDSNGNITGKCTTYNCA